MTTDCSLCIKIVSSEYLQNMLLFLFSFDIQNNFGTQHVLQMLRASHTSHNILCTNLIFRFRQTKQYPQNGSMTNMPICRTKVGILCKKKEKKKETENRVVRKQKSVYLSIILTFLSLLRSLSVAACLLSTRTTFFLQALQAHNRHCC